MRTWPCYTPGVNTPYQCRVLFLCLLLGMVPVLGRAAQQSLVPPAPEHDPFVGTWRTNKDKSRPHLSKSDTRYTRTIAREGDERVFSSITEGVRSSARSFRIRCDGQFHYMPALEHSMACQYTASNSVQGETKDANGHVGYWMEEVSPDLQEMTTTVYNGNSRTKIKRTFVFDRIN
jgi:hypothetical protein